MRLDFLQNLAALMAVDSVECRQHMSSTQNIYFTLHMSIRTKITVVESIVKLLHELELDYSIFLNVYIVI